MADDEGEKTDGDEEKQRTSSRLWTPYGDPGDTGYREERAPGPGPEESEEISEEEFRRRVEEAMEKITVADVVIDMMISLSSLAYQRMGIPRDVNEKYRDLEQARLAIDCLDALLEALSDRVPEETLKPLAGTLDNLKLNFVKES